jgi:hypothetical protein
MTLSETAARGTLSRAIGVARASVNLTFRRAHLAALDIANNDNMGFNGLKVNKKADER